MKRLHPTIEHRLAANSTIDGDCWPWVGRRNNDGYGLINFWVPGVGSRHRAAHIVAAELAHGPCPTGHEWHHKCLNRACIRPTHLEAIPRKKNRNTFYQRRRAMERSD